MRPGKDAVIEISFSEHPVWGRQWRVEIGHGEACIHDTTHPDEEDALDMVRVLMRGMMKG